LIYDLLRWVPGLTWDWEILKILNSYSLSLSFHKFTRTFLVLFILLGPAFSQEAIVEAFSKVSLRSLQISLQEMNQPHLAKWIGEQSAPAQLIGNTLSETGISLRDYLVNRLHSQSKSTDTTTLLQAYQRSAAFLRLDERPLQKSVKPTLTKALSHYHRTFSHLAEDLVSTVSQVNWHKVDSYVESRLGPLKELVRSLNPGDLVLLANLEIHEIEASLPRIHTIIRYNLPLSSYGKDIYLIHHENQRKTLILTSFDSRAYLIHFGLLISRFRQFKSLSFEIAELIDPKRLERSYRQLLKFAMANPGLFSDLKSLVIGYSSTFEKKWKVKHRKSVSQRGFPGENWTVSVYEMKDGSRVGVLGGDVDYYGEALVRQIEKLVGVFPIEQVFFGGSGGSLVPRSPYSLYRPSTIRSPSGYIVKNALQGSSDSGIHFSVDSPLLEYPLKLKQMVNMGIYSLDMEGGHLADLAVKNEIEVGVAILVTDFPLDYGIDVALGRQDFALKNTAREEFVTQVEQVISQEPPSFMHQIENLTDRSILEMSRQNLQRLRSEVYPLTSKEAALVNLLNSIPYGVNLRMSPGRLYYTLKDRATFSTGLVESLGMEVKPYTPELEDRLYGAYDYVFAEYSSALGRDMYGKTIVRLKPEYVLPRSFATRVSGWQISKNTASLPFIEQQHGFAKEVYHFEHYSQALTLLTIKEIRKLSEDEKLAFFNNSEKDWNTLPFEIRLRYLELKIKNFVLRSEILKVMLPPEAKGDIPAILEANAIPYEYYDSKKLKEDLGID
jgi:hypothetical protein